MLLHPPQTPLATTPLMPQITGDSPIFGLPLFESSQIDRNACVNLSPLHDPGLYAMYNQLGVRNSTDGEFSKSRKRGREDDLGLSSWINTKTTAWLQSSANGLTENQTCSPSPSCGGDIYLRMLKEQQELDLLILMHMEKLREEMEQKRRHYWSNILRTVEERLQKIESRKDEEIAKMNRRNTALEEKVKMLVMEGQIWKGLAQTNEAAAMSLRRDLELAQAREGEGDSGQAEDSSSCCYGHKEDDNRSSCHGCRRKEICILVLPCRHLCLCSDCDPQFDSCPLCMAPKSASIKVHIS